MSLPDGPLARTRLPLSVVAKPTGASCNLDCQYCFFLSKELLYDNKRQLMSEDTLHRYVAEFLAASADGEVTMLWQGGEPTMRGLPFFERVVELCEQLRRPTQTVTHALQTNATLIDEKWATFLAKNDFLVGVSFDGPEDLHDAYRVNKGGRGSHALVLRGWRLLQEAEVRLNVLCTVHRANQDHGARIYRYFRDELGAQFLQFIPIVERVAQADLPKAEAGWRTDSGERLLYLQAGDAVTSRSVSPKAYGQFLIDVVDEWIKADVGKVYVQDIDTALSAMFGQYPLCVHAPECGNNLAMEFNGDTYTCDHWVEPDWLLGNVSEASFAELASTATMKDFAKKKRIQLTEQCKRCPVRRLCHGGCPKDRFTTSIDGEPGQNYLCEGYFTFYTALWPDLVAMARLLNSGRAPAEIMTPEIRARFRPNSR